jgi:hypothetical protein
MNHVISAASRFTERRFPLQTLVYHPDHGQGSVVAVNGSSRNVAFSEVIIETEHWPDLGEVQSVLTRAVHRTLLASDLQSAVVAMPSTNWTLTHQQA